MLYIVTRSSHEDPHWHTVSSHAGDPTAPTPRRKFEITGRGRSRPYLSNGEFQELEELLAEYEESLMWTAKFTHGLTKCITA
jgi:hypothetical protein